MANWHSCFSKIGMSSVAIERADLVIGIATEAFPIGVEKVFVTNEIDGSEEQSFSSVWLYSKQHMMELKNFMTDITFDIVRREGNTRYFRGNVSRF